MINEKITVINVLGLHTRAAAKLVALASKFESKIEIQKNDQAANCKSIMSIIVLGATKGTVTVPRAPVGDDSSMVTLEPARVMNAS